jgi:YdjC-like protein
MRRLIVNADDFGQNAGFNEGIIRCFERGVLTSASLMVRWPDAQAAAEYARVQPAFSIGLHIDLGEWRYRDDKWVELYSVLPDEDPATIRAEVMRQLETFRTLLGSDPTHLDSHQHVHCSGPADRVVTELGATLGIPVRQRSEAVKYVGGFYGQGRNGETLDAPSPWSASCRYCGPCRRGPLSSVAIRDRATTRPACISSNANGKSRCFAIRGCARRWRPKAFSSFHFAM